MATGGQQVLSARGCGRRPPATRHPHNYARRSLLLTNVHPAGRLATRESLGRARDTLPCTCGFCYTISLPSEADGTFTRGRRREMRPNMQQL
jgi:hypothetical protein